MISQLKDLTSQHNHLTSDGRKMPPKICDRNTLVLWFINYVSSSQIQKNKNIAHIRVKALYYLTTYTSKIKKKVNVDVKCYKTITYSRLELSIADLNGESLIKANYFLLESKTYDITWCSAALKWYFKHWRYTLEIREPLYKVYKV